MQNDDKERLQQPPIHTHLPDTVPPEDVKKIVGEAVPHGADYNSPPPPGAGKSMGSGLDDSVGGPTMGADPAPRGQAATTRDQDSRADDQHMGNRQQGSQQQGSQQGNQQQGNQQSGNQQQGNQQSGKPQQGKPQQQQQQQQQQQKGNQQQGGQPQGDSGNTQSDSAAGGSQSGAPGNAQRATEQRSEGLLPAGGEADGRFEVGEEVSFDQQSDQARKVGSMEEAAKGPHGDKLAGAVAGTLGKDSGKP